MIPRPPIERPVAYYDTECYPNYWLLKFRPRGGKAYTFAIHAGQSFVPEQIARIHTLFEAYQTISFNGRGYDVWMISAALVGYTPECLKWLNDQIIVERVKPWTLNLPRWEPADHIDVMEVAPGAGGLKQFAARIHSRSIRDLPYDPGTVLTSEQIAEVDTYCENDLDDLEDLHNGLQPQLQQREALSKRYGVDLRSKSDAQLAETVLKLRCEQALGRKIYKQEIDWNMTFQCKVPSFIAYQMPQLCHALDIVRNATFRLGASGAVEMPPQLEALAITIGGSTYKLGIGGLHSQEKCTSYVADETYVIRDNDVASYYPSLILNSGEYPAALGYAFLQEYEAIKNERLECKATVKRLKALGDISSLEYVAAKVGDDGGKIQINGTFGKTGSPYSLLFAPTMLIQTTIPGQLSLLMLIEWHEHYGISVKSANTDGIVIMCRRDQVHVSEELIAEWQKRTGLEMETVEYAAVYSRDVNNYFAVKLDGDVKRKGEYSKSGLVEKKNPDVEICSDAVAAFLSKGVPLIYTISMCTDIRKFLVVQNVKGGGVKMWGEGARKGTLVRDMIPTIEAHGWVKRGRKWVKPYTRELIDSVGSGTGAPVPGYEPEFSVQDAYAACFAPQRPEYLGKVCRWYYGKNSPGPIVYASNGNTVSLSYGAQPCMVLPDTLPDDIDYAWYVAKAESILVDVGYQGK